MEINSSLLAILYRTAAESKLVFIRWFSGGLMLDMYSIHTDACLSQRLGRSDAESIIAPGPVQEVKKLKLSLWF